MWINIKRRHLTLSITLLIMYASHYYFNNFLVKVLTENNITKHTVFIKNEYFIFLLCAITSLAFFVLKRDYFLTINKFGYILFSFLGYQFGFNITISISIIISYIYSMLISDHVIGYVLISIMAICCQIKLTFIAFNNFKDGNIYEWSINGIK